MSPLCWLKVQFATTSHKGIGKKGSCGNTKYISDAEWKAMSPEAQTKKAAGEDEVDKSSTSSKSAKTMKSMSKTIKSQEKDNRSQNER